MVHLDIQGMLSCVDGSRPGPDLLLFFCFWNETPWASPGGSAGASRPRRLAAPGGGALRLGVGKNKNVRRSQVWAVSVERKFCCLMSNTSGAKKPMNHWFLHAGSDLLLEIKLFLCTLTD